MHLTNDDVSDLLKYVLFMGFETEIAKTVLVVEVPRVITQTVRTSQTSNLDVADSKVSSYTISLKTQRL